MIKCYSAFLTLELINVTNATVDDCLFGNMTFTQVQQVIIRNSMATGRLNFFNSSGSIENITTNDIFGLNLQNYSYVEITISHFVNVNTMEREVFKVLTSSTIVMSDSTMKNNQGGAIFCSRSIVHLANTYFTNNKADLEGGAIFVTDKSFMRIRNCTFRDNQVIYENAHENIAHNGEGGTISLYGSTAEMFDVNFIQNRAAIKLYNRTMINAYGLKCVGQSGFSSSCISASNYCQVSINNSTFSENNGSVLSLQNNCTLLVVNSSFINNITPLRGGAIYSYKSSLKVSHSVFHHNKAVYRGVFLRV